MRYLNRPEAPKCLPATGSKNFNDLKASNKRKIWVQLNKMQGSFCAYCEKEIKKRERQIEHFYPKKNKPDGMHSYNDLSSSWDNLFGACINNEHCGQHKDREGPRGPGAYSPNNLIKPDKYDPSEILIFTEAGDVTTKDFLSKDVKFRGKETIRVFNLNTPSLISSRKGVIDAFNIRLTSILELHNQASLNNEQFKCEINELREDIKTKEHQTAVKMVLNL